MSQPAPKYQVERSATGITLDPEFIKPRPHKRVVVYLEQMPVDSAFLIKFRHHLVNTLFKQPGPADESVVYLSKYVRFDSDLSKFDASQCVRNGLQEDIKSETTTNMLFFLSELSRMDKMDRLVEHLEKCKMTYAGIVKYLNAVKSAIDFFKSTKYHNMISDVFQKQLDTGYSKLLEKRKGLNTLKRVERKQSLARSAEQQNKHWLSKQEIQSLCESSQKDFQANIDSLKKNKFDKKVALFALQDLFVAYHMGSGMQPRGGVLAQVTLQLFDKMLKEKNQMIQITRHKTFASHGPLTLVLPSWFIPMINQYRQHIRPSFERPHNKHSHLLFLNSKGNPIRSHEYLQKGVLRLLPRDNVHINPTDMRKIITTLVCKTTNPKTQQYVHSAQSHSSAVAEEYYNQRDQGQTAIRASNAVNRIIFAPDSDVKEEHVDSDDADDDSDDSEESDSESEDSDSEETERGSYHHASRYYYSDQQKKRAPRKKRKHRHKHHKHRRKGYAVLPFRRRKKRKRVETEQDSTPNKKNKLDASQQGTRIRRVSMERWSSHQTDMLLKHVAEFKARNNDSIVWKAIAERMGDGKTSNRCRQKFNRCLQDAYFKQKYDSYVQSHSAASSG